MKTFAPCLLRGDDLNLSDSAMAATLNGLAELWHPSLLPFWSSIPAAAPVGQHVDPKAGQLYVVPEGMALGLPEDWNERAKRFGSMVVVATEVRSEVRLSLFQALGQSVGPEPPPAFFGLGFGRQVLADLAEAMGHGDPLNEAEFWELMQQASAASTEESQRPKLQAAADLLRAARDVLYPSTLHLLDLALLDDWPEGSVPCGLEFGTPVNLVAAGETLARWARLRPADFGVLKAAFDARTAELCGGVGHNQPDGLLPAETQFSNLAAGAEIHKLLLGQTPAVHARSCHGASLLWPELVASIGQKHALLLPFDKTAAVPAFKGAVMEWPNPAGKSLLAFVRPHKASEEAATWFRLPQFLHETILQDFAALLVHASRSPEPTWHRDWLALHQLAPVFGQPVCFSSFFSETYASEHPPTLAADDFFTFRPETWLNKESPPPSFFAAAARRRRLFGGADACAGMLRGLSKPTAAPLDLAPLKAAEALLAKGEAVPAAELEAQRAAVGAALAKRLTLRATGESPGHLVLNPTSFARRVLVDLPGVATPLPAPAKATQLQAGSALASVELPPFGFAWLPHRIEAGTKIAQPKQPLVEKLLLRNEHIEAELDERTGGLKELRDPLRNVGRLGIQLVHAGGSSMKLTHLVADSTGPSLGSFRAEGELRGSDHGLLASFGLHYELGWGVPYLKIRIELDQVDVARIAGEDGYLAARLTWADATATIARSVGWTRQETKLLAFETTDYVEIGSGPVRTALLTGGLPFFRRRSARQADLLLVTPSETARRFEIALAVDADEPLLLAEDWLAPPLVVPTAKGPPPGGPIGWLFDIDSSHVLVTSLSPAADGSDGVVLRLAECRGVSGEAQLRCPRQPIVAELIDDRGEFVSALTTVDDTVFLHFAPFEAVRVRLAFSA